jgi:hypothetical protein
MVEIVSDIEEIEIEDGWPPGFCNTNIWFNRDTNDRAIWYFYTKAPQKGGALVYNHVMLGRVDSLVMACAIAKKYRDSLLK